MMMANKSLRDTPRSVSQVGEFYSLDSLRGLWDLVKREL